MPRADEVFEQHRPALARLAYRMLGCLADADDVLQDAYLRWSRADHEAVQSPQAYLLSIVTHLCIDARQAVENRKTTYVGPWLPEPIVEPALADPSAPVETAESVSMALLLILESLSPVERAAYLLRRIFNYDYDVIAKVLERSEPSCRQIVSRAEQRIHDHRPRFDADPAEAQRLTGEFLYACSTGDLNGLEQMLASDAVLYSDGGGKTHAALAPIRGADKIARFFVSISKKAAKNMVVRAVRVNGQPGFITQVDGQVIDVVTLDVLDGRIANCFVIRNPDKLAHVAIA